MVEVASDISTSEGESDIIEIIARGRWVPRTYRWLSLAWHLLARHIPVAVEILGRYYVYGRRKLAAQVLRKSVLDLKEFKWFLKCCLGPFMMNVPCWREFLVLEFRDPDDL